MRNCFCANRKTARGFQQSQIEDIAAFTEVFWGSF